jgi:hypothetical protein
MKKITFILTAILLVTAISFISSCKKSSSTNNTPPVISFKVASGFISKDTTVKSGSKLTFGINASASSGNLKEFKVQRASSGKPAGTAYDTSFSSSGYAITLKGSAVGSPGAETWTFTVYDDNGNSASISLVITTTTTVSYGPIDTWSGKTLGSIDDQKDDHCFSSSTGLVYKMADAKAADTIIDWLYYYGTSSLATIVAPDDYIAVNNIYIGADGLASWSVRNATQFQKVTGVSNWDGIVNDSLILLNTQSGDTATAVTKINVNDVLSFITGKGKKGLIRVNAINIGGNGNITFDVKVQKTIK